MLWTLQFLHTEWLRMNPSTGNCNTFLFRWNKKRISWMQDSSSDFCSKSLPSIMGPYSLGFVYNPFNFSSNCISGIIKLRMTTDWTWNSFEREAEALLLNGAMPWSLKSWSQCKLHTYWMMDGCKFILLDTWYYLLMSYWRHFSISAALVHS